MAILTLPCLSVGMVMLTHDRLAERMERLATLDDLTGVLGRWAFIARTEALFDLPKTARSKLSIAILDDLPFAKAVIGDGLMVLSLLLPCPDGQRVRLSICLYKHHGSLSVYQIHV